MLFRQGRSLSDRSSSNTSNSQAKPLSARSLALNVLMAWQKEPEGMRKPISRLLEAHTQDFSISSLENALLHELVYGVLRHKTWLDWRIDAFLQKKDLPLEVRTVLELCAFQIDFLDRVPVSAAVNEAVRSVKTGRHAWSAGLVNAVARRLSQSRANPFHLPLPLQDRLNALPALKRLSILFSHPVWLLKRWERRMSLKEIVHLCRWNNLKAGLCLRVNTLRITRDGFMELLQKAGFSPRPGYYSLQAVWLDDFFGNPTKLPGFSEGFFQVQDEAAQLAAYCLDPQPNDSILDFCAGLGGKTTHLAELTGDGVPITAYDTSEARLRGLRQNAARLGIKSIAIINNNKQLQSMRFSRILLDAPCSGLGTLRRHPDIKWNRTERFISESAVRQLELLNQAAGLLLTDGLLCYVTCTAEPEETTSVVAAFLNTQTGFELVNPNEYLPEAAKKFVTSGCFMEIPPQENGPDIFFMALLRKRRA